MRLNVRIPTSVCCPVCSVICADSPLYTYTSEQAASHFCPISRNADRYQRLERCITRLWKRKDSVVLRCRECGFAFGYPFVGGDEEFYSILHEQKDYPKWRWDYDVALREAITRKRGGRILEVGAGTGNFLKALGGGWECFAVEASDSNRTDLERRRIKVFRDLSHAVAFGSGTFRIVAMFQVLEHISDFADLLKNCRRLLSDDGQLVVTVPDGDAMIRQEKLVGCADMPPNHICKWTPKSLSYALREAGFNPLSEVPEPASIWNVAQSLHMKVCADATNRASLAARVYRIQSKGLRVPFLSCLAFPALTGLLPHWRDLRKGGAFAIISGVNQT